MTYSPDIFFSYDQSASEGVAQYAEKLIRSIHFELNPVGFFDRSFPPFVTKTPYDDAGPDAAASAGLFVVLRSRNWAADEARVKELAQFQERATKDGRTHDSVIFIELELSDERATGLNEALSQALSWGLKGNSNRDFLDQNTKRPLDLERIAGDDFTDDFKACLGRLVRDLRLRRNKLLSAPVPEEDSHQLAVQPAEPSPLDDAAASGPKPDGEVRPTLQVYLQPSPHEEAWNNTSEALAAHLGVNPQKWEPLKFDLSKKREHDARRRSILADCEGVVFVRAQPDDWMADTLAAARRDYDTLLLAMEKRLVWVLVDWVDDEGPELQPDIEERLTRIPVASAPNWPTEVRTRLQL